jgi:Receptor family ligand binding region
MLWSWSRTIEAQVLQPGTTCKIMTFIPFTDRRDPPPPPQNASQLGSPPSTYGYGTWIDPVTQAKAAFSLMAAAELARYHFNTRDTTIVPELGQLNDCPITMPDPEEHEVKYLDSGYDKISAVRTFHDTRFILDQIDGMNNGGGSVDVGSLVNGRPSENSTWLPQNDRHFCALIGPVHPYVVDGISGFAESGRIPLIAYETTSAKFSAQRQYPFFASTIPNAYDFGEVISKAFRDIWTREGIGILDDIEDYGDFGVQLERPLREFIETFDHEAIFAHMYQFEDESIRAALSNVTSKGYRTIIVLNDRPASIEKIAQVADSMNMVGPGYFWLLMGAAFRPSTIQSMKYAVNSPMDKLLRGAALFTNYDRSIYGNQNDPFLATWKTQNVLSIDQLNRLQPIDMKTKIPYYTANASYFQDEVPSEYASYMYDAVILTGISVCNDYKRNFGNGNFTHIEEIRRTEFTGASGRVRFAPKDYIVKYDDSSPKKSINQLLSKFKTKSSRDPQDAIFGIYNIQRGDVDSQNMQRYVVYHKYTLGLKFVITNILTRNCSNLPVKATNRC